MIKKSKIRYAMAALCLLSAITSCELIIEMDLPKTAPKIVVNGLIGPDLPMTINLSKSLMVLEEDDFAFLPGAKVQLYTNESLIGLFEAETDGYYNLPHFEPIAGMTYRLTVDYPGLQSVEAVTTVPEVVPIISWDTVSMTNEWGFKELKLKVRFNDPAGMANRYGLAVTTTFREFDYLTMQPSDKWITQPAYVYAGSDIVGGDEWHYYGGKIYFDDILFDGQDKTMDISLSDYSYLQADTIRVDIHLEHIDSSFYKYVVSNEAYQTAHNNPFAEPVQVYTNINGGFGIFSAYSFSAKSFFLFSEGNIE